MKNPIVPFAIILLLMQGCAAHSGPTNESSHTQAAMTLALGGASDPVAATPLSSATTSTIAGSDADTNDDEGTDDPQTPEEMLDSALDLVESSQEYWNAGDRDHAIEALDQAYSDILNVPDDTSTKEQQQQKDDLRFLISKRLMDIYAARFIATSGTAKEIPLVINDYVQREIQVFQGIERDYFLESYRRSGKYHDTIVKAFRDAGLPEELAWLPMIESGFKVRAMSRARALGLWQFIPSTGYKYGLKRNSWVDERLDPEKSTAAAIAYLKDLHQIFGDWATVLAAYNCGEGNVLRAIRGQKVDYLDNFWDLYERLPSETARYYPRFLAVLAILKDPAKYGFTLSDPDKPVPYEVVSVVRPVNLKKIADKIGCADNALSDLNPELRFQATPDTPYDLRVPPGTKDAVVACLDSLPKWTPPHPTFVVHRVRRGETLSTIAMRYRTSVHRIMDVNNLRSGRMIRIGQRLKIPLRVASAS